MEGRPAGRPASVGSGLDASRIADQDRGLPPTTLCIRRSNRAGVRRSFEARWVARATGDQDLTSPPIRAGWALASPTLCKSAVHSEVVRIHPCPPVSVQQSAAVAQWQSGSLPTSRRGVRFSPAAPIFCIVIRTGSSAVERRVEGARVGGSIPSLCTKFGAIAQKGERLLCKQDVVGSIPSGSTNHAKIFPSSHLGEGCRLLTGEGRFETCGGSHSFSGCCAQTAFASVF
jgi:hypothetical protein